MKRIAIFLFTLLVAGCAGMHGYDSSGASAGNSSGSGLAPAQEASPFDRFDPSFRPYFGG